MPEMTESNKGARITPPMILAAIMVVVVLALGMLYLGLARYYNAQEVKMLVDGAEANGRGYTLVIHNSLTLSYSFEAH